MNILQSIFTDYYEPIIYKLHPRPPVIENVNKMIHCGDPSHGGAMYGCPHCGNKYNQLRSFHMSCKLVSCVHHHCVFTIPEELRIYFLEDRTLLDCLFHSVRNVVHAFYVRAKPNLCTPDITIKYISRYLGRPVIATSRIDDYDGENVTFHYTRHEDNKTVTETIPALDFIQKLIVHIPEKHFKMLRYYGVYAKHHKQEKKLLVLEVYHKKRHKQRHGESNIRSFVMSFFISSLLYTISDDLRNFL